MEENGRKWRLVTAGLLLVLALVATVELAIASKSESYILMLGRSLWAVALCVALAGCVVRWPRLGGMLSTLVAGSNVWGALVIVVVWAPVEVEYALWDVGGSAYWLSTAFMFATTSLWAAVAVCAGVLVWQKLKLRAAAA